MTGLSIPATPTHRLVRQTHAELRKALSTRLWWALLLPAAALSFLVNLAVGQAESLTFTTTLGMALALGSFSAKLAALYGVVAATAETRHRTLSTTYLALPDRPLVCVAKALVAALIGAGYAVCSAAAGLLGMLAAGGISGGQTGTVLAVCAVAVPIFALWAVFGVGVGHLLHGQLAAIVTLLLYLLLGEQIVAGLASLSGLGQIDGYLPGGSAAAVLTDLASAGTLAGTLLGGGTVPWWLALLIFAGYAVLGLAAGAAAARGRDVT